MSIYVPGLGTRIRRWGRKGQEGETRWMRVWLSEIRGAPAWVGKGNSLLKQNRILARKGSENAERKERKLAWGGLRNKDLSAIQRV